MDKNQLIEAYFNAQNLEINVGALYMDLLLTAALAFLLSRIYTRFGTSLSNKRNFAANFIVLALTTMLIISIVKTSLALSLGLVGALSIVRFRAAIKEPEELTYLFLAIALGLGFGSSQRYVTIIGFIFICAFLVLRGVFSKARNEHNLYLNVSTQNSGKVSLDEIVNALRDHCTFVSLKRVDKNPDNIEALLFVRIENLKNLQNSIDSLEKLDKGVKLSFLEDRGVFN
jgi:hypothetical protein